MKALSIAVLVALTGIVEASESEQCGSAVEATVDFMTSTYGVNSNDVSVQVVSAKKSQKDQLVADVLTRAGNHKCALKLSPAVPRERSLYICQWSLQVVSCDSPDISKRDIIDEPSWANDKASAKSWREGMQKNLQQSSFPAEAN